MRDQRVNDGVVDQVRAVRLRKVQVEEERRLGDPVDGEVAHDGHGEEVNDGEGAKHGPVDEPDRVVVGSLGADGLNRHVGRIGDTNQIAHKLRPTSDDHVDAVESDESVGEDFAFLPSGLFQLFHILIVEGSVVRVQVGNEVVMKFMEIASSIVG